MKLRRVKKQINPKSLANLRAAKKGEVKNPLGANGGGDLLRIRYMGSKEVAEIGTLVLDKNFEAIKEIVDDAKNNPNSEHSALTVWMATVAYKGITKGDPYAMDALLNRIVGKVRQEFEIIPQQPSPKPDADPVDVEARRDRIAKYQKMISQVKDVECTVEVLPPEEPPVKRDDEPHT